MSATHRRVTSDAGRQRWLPVVNTGTVEIPGFAVMEVVTAGPETDYVADGSSARWLFEVGLPRTGNYILTRSVTGEYGPEEVPYNSYWTRFAGLIMFNGEAPIQPGTLGRGTVDRPGLALVTDSTLSSSILVVQGGYPDNENEEVDSESASFELKRVTQGDTGLGFIIEATEIMHGFLDLGKITNLDGPDGASVHAVVERSWRRPPV